MNQVKISGCRWFDTAIKGYGGCPMAKDDLTGNIAIENLLSYLKDKGIDTGINMEHFAGVRACAGRLFN